LLNIAIDSGAIQIMLLPVLCDRQRLRYFTPPPLIATYQAAKLNPKAANAYKLWLPRTIKSTTLNAVNRQRNTMRAFHFDFDIMD
jgi:hypothetical protein